MTPEERDAAYHTLITCDGKGKEAKAEALRRLIEWHRADAHQRDPIAELPWKREREGRPGDRFDHNGCTVEVESRADGNVYYRASGKHGNHDCQNTIEEFHRLVTKAMDTGAKFTPAP
jgi:hypothetical protein